MCAYRHGADYERAGALLQLFIWGHKEYTNVGGWMLPSAHYFSITTQGYPYPVTWIGGLRKLLLEQQLKGYWPSWIIQIDSPLWLLHHTHPWIFGSNLSLLECAHCLVVQYFNYADKNASTTIICPYHSRHWERFWQRKLSVAFLVLHRLDFSDPFLQFTESMYTQHLSQTNGIQTVFGHQTI